MCWSRLWKPNEWTNLNKNLHAGIYNKYLKTFSLFCENVLYQKITQKCNFFIIVLTIIIKVSKYQENAVTNKMAKACILLSILLYLSYGKTQFANKSGRFSTRATYEKVCTTYLFYLNYLLKIDLRWEAFTVWVITIFEVFRFTPCHN